MRWILLDLVIVLGALGVLALVLLRLWRTVKALGREVATAGERVSSLTDALALGEQDAGRGQRVP